MRKISTVLIVVAVLAFASATYAYRYRANIEVSNQTYSFGEAPPGSEIQHTFVLRNPGFRRLTIGDVKTSCQCTTPELAAYEIGPLGSLEIPVTAKLPVVPGQFESFVYVSIEGRPTVELRIFGGVYRAFPPVIDFGALKKGETPSNTVRPVFPELENVAIKSLQFDNSLIFAEIVNDPKLAVRVQLLDTLPFGDFFSLLEVEVEGHPAPYGMEVTGRILSPIEMKEDRVQLEHQPEISHYVGSATIYAPYGESIRLVELTTSDDRLNYDTTISQDGSEMRIEFALDSKFLTSETYAQLVKFTAQAGDTVADLSVLVLAIADTAI